MHVHCSGYNCYVFIMIYMDLLALKVDSQYFTQKDIRMLREKCLIDILKGEIGNFPESLLS